MDFTSLTFTEVSRNFGRRRALNRVSLQCEAGEIVALLGPNGAGKSTLLSITATLLEPSSGTVRYGTHAARDAGGALRARIGLLGHDLYIYPELTAAENLEFFGKVYGLPDVARRVEVALDRAELTHRRDDLVAGFSRGMRQRLALERALLHDPRLVLLDEPFTGLDDAATGALRQRLAGLKDSGAIVLVTTHDHSFPARAPRELERLSIFDRSQLPAKANPRAPPPRRSRTGSSTPELPCSLSPDSITPSRSPATTTALALKQHVQPSSYDTDAQPTARNRFRDSPNCTRHRSQRPRSRLTRSFPPTRHRFRTQHLPTAYAPGTSLAAPRPFLQPS